MKRIALLSRSIDMDFLRPVLEEMEPDLNIATWPDPRSLHAEVAVCWDPPRGIYAQMPNLELVHSIAAGVDNVVDGQQLGDLKVCRVSDPMQAEGMLQYVLWGVLYFHRGLDAVVAGQGQRAWQRPPLVPAAECRVGVMGLGELGSHVASGLARFGYSVNGWARSPRAIEGVKVFAGSEDYPSFLAQTDLLVCLLPLTEATRGILDRNTFNALPPESALIHCGRGEHLVEDDLSDALSGGQLRGAIVDVFKEEPLPVTHRLWNAPHLLVTPHMATMASVKTIAQQVLRNLGQHRRRAPLFNEVDISRGY